MPVATVGVAAKDRTAPGLGIRAVRVLRLRSLRAQGLRVTVSCSEACRLTSTLTLDAAGARRLGLRSRRIALSRLTLSSARRRVFVLRPTAAARVRLRRGARAVLRVEARDAAGNRRVRTQQVTLRA